MLKKLLCVLIVLCIAGGGVYYYLNYYQAPAGSSGNLLEGVQWLDMGTFWYKDGTVVSTQYTDAYRAIAELIPVEPNTSYKLTDFAGVYTLYDADGLNGAVSAPVYDPNSTTIFKTTKDQLFIGISHTPEEDFPVERVSLIKDGTQTEESADGQAQESVQKPLAGKTVVCFGDSLFGMHRGEDSTPAYIAENTGATVYNVGFGGCRMSVHPYAGYEAFSMWALAGAIAENDWSWQETQAGEGSEYFADQLLLLESIDFNEVDAAVIHYGTNDFAAGNGIAVDNPENPLDYETLCGALRYSVEKLLGAYPKLKIYVSLPVYRYWTQEDGTIIYAEEYKNKSGHTLIEFCEALRGVAEEYNLPVIDGYRELGVNRINASAFLSDGTHFNAEGRQRFGEYIAARLMAQ